MIQFDVSAIREKVKLSEVKLSWVTLETELGGWKQLFVVRV